jgi:hypothetical protein
VDTYPEPVMFGPLPAQGFFVRHARNVEFDNVHIVPDVADARPVFWLEDVEGADFSRIYFSRRKATSGFLLKKVRDFRVFSSRSIPDTFLPHVKYQKI